jgi:hypothetical protein
MIDTIPESETDTRIRADTGRAIPGEMRVVGKGSDHDRPFYQVRKWQTTDTSETPEAAPGLSTDRQRERAVE